MSKKIELNKKVKITTEITRKTHRIMRPATYLITEFDDIEDENEIDEEDIEEDSSDESSPEENSNEDNQDEIEDAVDDLLDRIKEKAQKKSHNENLQPQTVNNTPSSAGSTTPVAADTAATGSATSGGTVAAGAATGGTAAAGTAAAGATAGGTVAAGAAGISAGGVIAIIAIILIAILLIIIIVIVIIGGQSKSISAASTLYQECSTLTVVDTDCDANGNCTNKYSGKVSFEDYIAGVIAAEDNINSDSLEYYKTVAIVTRTELVNLIDTSCEVEGNSSFKNYIPIEESTNQDIIQKAVEETSGKIITKDEMLMSSPSTTACLINQDDTDYYIRFGSQILEETKIQKVSKKWVLTTSYNDLLEEFSTQISLTEDEFSRDCPEGTNDYGISLVGAYYLIDNVNYKTDEVIKYYYGDDIQVKDAKTIIGENVNGFINPLSTLNCTSAFGGRIHPTTGKQSYHSGIDLGAVGGTPIYATKSGVISRVVRDVTIVNAKTSSSNNGYGYGNNIIIDHQDGTSTLYAHMKYGSIPSSLSVGDEVEQGEEIGQVGTTGVSTGNHLHYEVRINNSAVDPSDYLDLSAATGTCRR